MNYFEYNGVKSSDMGLRIKSKNVYSSPKFDSQFVSVPGRNGDLIVSNNRFENIQITYNVFLSAKSIDELSEKLRKVKSWLYSQPTGYHNLTDSYDKKFFRKAVFASSLDIEDELNKIGVFTISFNCKPFKYSFDGDMPHYIKGTMSDFSLIFCRMDGSTSNNNWDNRWNQTVDLKLSGENNMYIIAENSWGDGNWGTYSPSQANTVYLKVNENWKKDNARFAVFTFGSKGEYWYSMTRVTDNIYSAVLPTPSYTTLENPYSFESKPYIRVFGNGDGRLSVGAIKSYCYRHGLNTESIKNSSGFCKNCGKPILNPSKTRPRRFCSDACKTAWWNLHRYDHKNSSLIKQFKCNVCGKEFADYSSTQRKYCSRICYQKRGSQND